MCLHENGKQFAAVKTILIEWHFRLFNNETKMYKIL